MSSKSDKIKKGGFAIISGRGLTPWWVGPFLCVWCQPGADLGQQAKSGKKVWIWSSGEQGLTGTPEDRLAPPSASHRLQVGHMRAHKSWCPSLQHSPCAWPRLWGIKKAKPREAAELCPAAATPQEPKLWQWECPLLQRPRPGLQPSVVTLPGGLQISPVAILNLEPSRPGLSGRRSFSPAGETQGNPSTAAHTRGDSFPSYVLKPLILSFLFGSWVSWLCRAAQRVCVLSRDMPATIAC